MNTVQSDKVAKAQRERGPQYERRVVTHRQVFGTTSDKLFPLFCPTTEYDWIDGWHGELIYSRSGYQEYNLVFRTDFFGFDEVWVMSNFEPNRAIGFVRTSEHLSIKVDITVCDNLDGTSTGDWVINATALTARGNEMLRGMKPEDEPLGLLVAAVDHYINTDTIMPLPAERFNKRS